jgi:hypothetical protein
MRDVIRRKGIISDQMDLKVPQPQEVSCPDQITFKELTYRFSAISTFYQYCLIQELLILIQSQPSLV